MSSNRLTPEAMRENAIALATALVVDEGEAAIALDLCILISADPADATAQHVAQEAFSLLERTVRCKSVMTPHEVVGAELIFGSVPARTDGIRIYVDIMGDRAAIGRNVRPAGRCTEVPKILGLLVACYASSAALHHALNGALALGLPEPLIVEFAQLGVNLKVIAQPVDLGRAYLAGAGAIGNGLLWAARYLDIRGQLDLVDDDRVASGNLNRQIWFDTDDIGKPKVERLAAHAQPFMPFLKLVPRQSRLQDLAEKSEGPWLGKLIVAVDSRRARRALQNEFPREVFDASTTDIREIVVHHNIQPTDVACLSCIYEPDQEELSREQHIADHLGVTLEAVRSERISTASAQIIAARFSILNAADLVGTAYDSLFKRLCAESALQTLEGKRVVAPFAFVSVLAGTILALELVRRQAIGSSENDNYWRLSPWHPPFARRRMLRPRQTNCAFCGNAVLRKVNESMWRERSVAENV
jgi:hypothetical protein